jgi:hypothetical protein
MRAAHQVADDHSSYRGAGYTELYSKNVRDLLEQLKR